MSNLQHVMERLGRIIAADQQLQVEVRGSLAYAVKGRVVIPAIENYEWLGRDARRMLHGMLDHECGHASFTDFDRVEQIAKEHTPAFKNLWNALEDGFIERKQGTRYRGCAQNIEKLHNWFWERGSEGDNPTSAILTSGEDLWSRFILACNIAVAPYGGGDYDAIRTLSPELYGMLMEVKPLLDQVATAESTDEIYAITKAIYDHFDKQGERSEEEPDEGPGDGGSAGGEEEGGEEEGGEEEEGGMGGGASQPTKGRGEKKAKPARDDGDADDEGDADDDGDADGGRESKKRFLDLDRWTKPGDTALSPSEAVGRRIMEIFEDPNKPYVVFTHDFDLVRDFSTEVHADGGDYQRQANLARRTGEALTSAFATALKAKQDQRAVSGFDEGIPDPYLMAEYAVGACPADQLYQQYVAEDSDDVAVSILLDCSGSMGGGPGSPAWLARQAAIALHQGLSGCQLAHEITGFTTIESSYTTEWTQDKDWPEMTRENFRKLREALKEAQANGTRLEDFARCLYRGYSYTEALQVPMYGIFKSFGADDARGLMRATGVANNLDGEAVIWQAKRLAERPEKRRVMFVLSDGQPAGSRDNAQGQRYLKEAIGRVREAGIEIYGIGMQSRAVSEYYPEFWVCHDLEDLSRLALTVMSDVLLRSRKERQWVKVA